MCLLTGQLDACSFIQHFLVDLLHANVDNPTLTIPDCCITFRIYHVGSFPSHILGTFLLLEALGLEMNYLLGAFHDESPIS